MNNFVLRSFFVLLCCVCDTTIAAPQVGWWWNPNESGRGFFVESHSGVTFIGAYLYDADGHATWLVAGGPNADPYNFTGPLYYKSNGQTLFGSYVAPGDAIVVGTLTVHFDDDMHGTLTWPGGTVAIERQIFGDLDTDPTFRPFPGWWWNADESGSGYSIEIQGTTLFIVGFMYDDGGRPVWYYSAGPMSSETTYSGPVLQFANGQTMGGPYQPPGAPTTVATLDIAFAALDDATLTFTGTSGVAKSGRAKRSRSPHVKPQIPKPPFVFPLGFAGNFSLEGWQHTALEQVTDDIHLTFKITDAVLPEFHGSDTGFSDFYAIARGGLEITYSQMTHDALVGDCTGTGSFTANVSDHLNDILLNIYTTNYGEYRLHGNVQPFVFSFQIAWNCVYTDGTSAMLSKVVDVLPWDTGRYVGAIFDDTIQGAEIKTNSAGPISQSFRWDWTFHAMRDIPPLSDELVH